MGKNKRNFKRGKAKNPLLKHPYLVALRTNDETSIVDACGAIASLVLNDEDAIAIFSKRPCVALLLKHVSEGKDFIQASAAGALRNISMVAQVTLAVPGEVLAQSFRMMGMTYVNSIGRWATDSSPEGVPFKNVHLETLEHLLATVESVVDSFGASVLPETMGEASNFVRLIKDVISPLACNVASPSLRWEALRFLGTCSMVSDIAATAVASVPQVFAALTTVNATAPLDVISRPIPASEILAAVFVENKTPLVCGDGSLGMDERSGSLLVRLAVAVMCGSSVESSVASLTTPGGWGAVEATLKALLAINVFQALDGTPESKEAWESAVSSLTGTFEFLATAISSIAQCREATALPAVLNGALEAAVAAAGSGPVEGIDSDPEASADLGELRSRAAAFITHVFMVVDDFSTMTAVISGLISTLSTSSPPMAVGAPISLALRRISAEGGAEVLCDGSFAEEVPALSDIFAGAWELLAGKESYQGLPPPLRRVARTAAAVQLTVGSTPLEMQSALTAVLCVGVEDVDLVSACEAAEAVVVLARTGSDISVAKGALSALHNTTSAFLQQVEATGELGACTEAELEMVSEISEGLPSVISSI